MVTRRPAQRMRLSLLFEQVFASEQLIAPHQYLRANTLLGLLLSGWGLALWLEPTQRLGPSLGLLGTGLVLSAAALLAGLWSSLRARVLVVQGSVIALLGLFTVYTTISWAIEAPPRAMFRYLPGLAAVLVSYGTLQIAQFGGFSRPRTTQLVGLCAGVALELIAAVFLVLRALG